MADPVAAVVDAGAAFRRLAVDAYGRHVVLRVSGTPKGEAHREVSGEIAGAGVDERGAYLLLHGVAERLHVGAGGDYVVVEEEPRART